MVTARNPGVPTTLLDSEMTQKSQPSRSRGWWNPGRHRASFSHVGRLEREAWARGLHRHPSPLRVESWEPVTHRLVAAGWGMWGSDLPAHGRMCWDPAQGTARCDTEEEAEGQWERAPTHQKTCTSQIALAGLEPPGTQWLRTTARHLAPDSGGGAPLGGSSGLDGAPSAMSPGWHGSWGMAGCWWEQWVPGHLSGFTWQLAPALCWTFQESQRPLDAPAQAGALFLLVQGRRKHSSRQRCRDTGHFLQTGAAVALPRSPEVGETM